MAASRIIKIHGEIIEDVDSVIGRMKWIREFEKLVHGQDESEKEMWGLGNSKKKFGTQGQVRSRSC